MRLGLLILAVAACGEVLPVPPVPPGEFTLTVVNPTASVPLGGANRVVLEATRSGGFTGDIVLVGIQNPLGLSVTGATIAADQTVGEVHVSAAAPLTIGATVTVTIEGSGTGVDSQTATLTNAPVTGQPGTLDVTFGAGGTGVATISLGSDDSGGFESLDVINGAVLGVGSSTGGLGATRFTLMRFTATGIADSTWNGGAVLRTVFSGGSNATSLAHATGRQNDGRSIAIGEDITGGGDIAIARYSLAGGNGGVDFGINGQNLVNLGGVEVIKSGLVLPANQIIAVGSLDGHFVIARMTSSGNLDTAFSTVGFNRTILGSSSVAENVELDSQNRILVAGSFDVAGQRDLVVRRYVAAGTLDGAFGANGVLVEGPDSETSLGVIVVGDKVLVGSVADTTTGKKYRVRRFLTDGTLDVAFGTQGVAEVTVAAATVARKMVMLPDGRIVFLGDVSGTAKLVRLTADGVVDTLFGIGGDGTVDLNIGDSGLPLTLSVYNDNQIVVGGGNQGGTPGPGTFAVIARMWM